MFVESGQKLLGPLTVGYHQEGFFSGVLNDCTSICGYIKGHVLPSEVPELPLLLSRAPYYMLLTVLSSPIVCQVSIVTLRSHLQHGRQFFTGLG